MRLIKVALAACFVACAPTSETRGEVSAANLEAARSSAHAEAAASLANAFIGDQWSTGLAIGIVDGESFETYGFGRRSAEDALVPNEDTVFEIGSISKVFTSLLLADAVTRGELELEQPVNELVPNATQLPSFEGQQITLRHLATHGSGLPSLPPNLVVTSLENPYLGYTAAKLYESLPLATLATKPGTAYAYSNWGAGLLGQILADHARSTYGDLVEKRIVQPLAMTRTSVRLPTENVAQGHDANGAPTPHWDLDGLAGAGAIRSSVGDLVRFVRANLDRPGDVGAALALAQRVHGEYPTMKLGLGWHLVGGLHFHNGETGGFHSFMAIDLVKKQGVVVLSDTAVMGLDALGFALVRTLRGEPATLGLPPLVAVSEQRLDTYVATYRHPDIELTVTRDGDRLYVQVPGQPRFRVFPSSDRTFHLRVVDASVEFRDGASGTVNELVLHQGGVDLALERVN